MNQEYDDLVFDVSMFVQDLIEKIEKINKRFLHNDCLKKELQGYYESEDGIESMMFANSVIELYHSILSI